MDSLTDIVTGAVEVCTFLAPGGVSVVDKNVLVCRLVTATEDRNGNGAVDTYLKARAYTLHVYPPRSCYHIRYLGSPWHGWRLRVTTSTTYPC